MKTKIKSELDIKWIEDYTNGILDIINNEKRLQIIFVLIDLDLVGYKVDKMQKRWRLKTKQIS